MKSEYFFIRDQEAVEYIKEGKSIRDYPFIAPKLGEFIGRVESENSNRVLGIIIGREDNIIDIITEGDDND